MLVGPADLTRPMFIVFGMLASATVVQAGGIPCERMEYAQLKDSTKKELTDAYCSAIAKADLNRDLRAIKQELFDKQLALGADTSATFRELQEYGKSQVSCLRVSEAASNMLAKKYSAKAPNSCK
jgi:hypothetical protein